MKKSIYYRPIHILLMTVLCTGILIFSTSVASGETSGLTEPPDTQKTTDISERLLKRKSELRLKISDETKKRLVERCGTAQSKVESQKTKDSQIRDKRFQRYNGILKRVSAMIGRLNQQGISTANLQTALTNYTTAVNQYLADAETYKAAIADLAAMACDKDAEGFSATLQTARTAKQMQLKDATEIRTAIAGIKQALADAKQALRDVEGDAN